MVPMGSKLQSKYQTRLNFPACWNFLWRED